MSKATAKIVIALNGKRNGHGGLFAVQGNGGSTDQRTLYVAGTIALKKGWKTSVQIFSKDQNWIAKSQSGFSCHMFKTFDGCTDTQQAEILAQVFAFSDGQMDNRNNSTEHTETKTLETPHPMVNVAADITYTFACALTAAVIVIQNL